MSTELARVEFSSEQVSLIKRTICQGSTDDELSLFLAQCKRTGLDPFARQIHAVKRWDKKQNREIMSIQIGIDGFRLIGERTGEADGQEGPFWCGKDGVWRDVWLSAEFPVAAKVLVYRKGRSHPYVGIAHWSEYAQTYKDGNPLPMWAQMPAGQLAKCAEALAQRKAFPQELSGLYSPEEMSHGDDAPAEAKPHANGKAAQPQPALPPKVAPALADQALAAAIQCDTLDALKLIVDEVNADIKAGHIVKADTDRIVPLIVAHKAKLEAAAKKPEGEQRADFPTADLSDLEKSWATNALAEIRDAFSVSDVSDTLRTMPAKPKLLPVIAAKLGCDPTASALFAATRPAPKAASQPTPTPEPDDGVQKAGGHIVQVLLALAHEVGVSWPEIRDGVEKGGEIATEAALPKFPIDFKATSLSADEALRLHKVLVARVEKKKENAAKRADNAKRREAEEVGAA